MINQKRRYVSPVGITNGHSCVLVIPRPLAKKFAIDTPTHVTIEDAGNGILIKKLEMK